MKSLGEVLTLSSQFLEARGIDKPRRLVEDLLSHLLRCKRIDLYMQFDLPMKEGEMEILRAWIKRAAKHEPVEYITGEVAFDGCKLRVDSRVLIPRVETEFLIEAVGKRLEGRSSVWDLCTGSGYIAIALKKKFPTLSVIASDISAEALHLASCNGKENGVEIEFLKGDFFSPMQGRKVDVIVCNPPYVSKKEFLELPTSVRDFEPHMALLGGDDGLDFYRRLASDAASYLTPRGLLCLEIGHLQGKAVKELFTQGIWKDLGLCQDLSGKDRFFFLEKQ